MNNKRIPSALIPIILAVGLIGGIFLGRTLFQRPTTPYEDKMRVMLGLIENEYVDEIGLDSIMEGTYSGLMAMLDPHSVYIPASEIDAVTDELEASFSGVGVSFQIINDTVNIIEIVPGGPGEDVGLRPGDKILKANDVDLTGANATNEKVFKNLRGPKGTEVTLTIKRSNTWVSPYVSRW